MNANELINAIRNDIGVIVDEILVNHVKPRMLGHALGGENRLVAKIDLDSAKVNPTKTDKKVICRILAERGFYIHHEEKFVVVCLDF